MKVLIITFLVVAVDQVTKILVKGLSIGKLGINISGMPYGSSKPIIGNFLRLTFIENPGIAFGFELFPRLLLVSVITAASLIMMIYIYRHRYNSFYLRLSLALILAGALGNLVDRSFYGIIYGYAPLFYGSVIDFIQIEFWDFTLFGKTYTSWPVLNIADISITAGCAVMIFFHGKLFKRDNKAIVIGQENLIIKKS